MLLVHSSLDAQDTLTVTLADAGRGFDIEVG
jgi:hypothetical protein